MNLIRPMQDKDLPAIIQIQESLTRVKVSDAWRQMLAEHVGEPKQVGLVAEKDGRVVGFIFGEIKVGGFGAELSGWIEMVGVRPELMGAGIGRDLAQGILDFFKSQGVEDVMTAVRWDSGDMLSFFKNMGMDRSPYINLRLKLN